jgi:hypothetical protein
MEALRLKIRRFNRLEELIDLAKSLFQKDAQVSKSSVPFLTK